jgi:hypothetical protein
MGQSRVMTQVVTNRYFTPHSNLIISHTLANRLNLPTHPIWIAFGSAIDTAFIVRSQIQQPRIFLHPTLAQKLKLLGQRPLNARYDPQSRRLQLGPLLGVMMNRDPEVGETEDQPFGLMTRFFEECAQACYNKGASFTVFAPEDISLANKCIQGWTYENSKWKQTPSPLPDIVYNRLTSRRLEQQADIQQKLQQLQSQRVKIFNETFLDKKEVHELLSKDEKTKHMLPETYPYHPARLQAMLQKYQVVFLKPTNGSLGHGIIRITRANGIFICQHSEPTGTITRKVTTFKETLRQLRRKVNPSKYVIQQGLDLVTCDGRPVDFRVLIQKNGHGQWRVTSCVGRIANDQQIVSNLARGGTLRKASEVLNSLPGLSNKPTVTLLHNTALEIAQTFEKLARGHFAELGIDLVLDIWGRLWMIEMNSKPSKTDDTVVTHPIHTIRPSVNRLVDYVLYATGWPIQPPIPRKKSSKPLNKGRRKSR